MECYRNTEHRKTIVVRDRDERSQISTDSNLIFLSTSRKVCVCAHFKRRDKDMKRIFKKFISLASNLVTRLNPVFCKCNILCCMQFQLKIQCNCSLDPMNVLIKSNGIHTFSSAFQMNRPKCLHSGDV